MLTPSFEKLPAVRKAIHDRFAAIRELIHKIKFSQLQGFDSSDRSYTIYSCFNLRLSHDTNLDH